MDQTAALRSQAEGLRAEITALQQQRRYNLTHMNLPLGEHTQDLLELVCGARAGVEATRRRHNALPLLKARVKELQESLARQTQMNGCSLTSCNIQTLEWSASNVLQKVCVTGQCSDLHFQVEFQLSEAKIEDGTESLRTVTGLNVVMNTEHFPDLASFVSRVEENNDLLLFFRTTRRFCQRQEERYSTYQYFQEKYPSVVSFPGGRRSEVMTINHSQLPGCVLFIHWSVGVSREGQVTPKVELLTKVPETAVQMSSCSLVEEAPQSFKSLLRLLGPKDAIEALIKSVSA